MYNPVCKSAAKATVNRRECPIDLTGNNDINSVAEYYDVFDVQFMKYCNSITMFDTLMEHIDSIKCDNSLIDDFNIDDDTCCYSYHTRKGNDIYAWIVNVRLSFISNDGEFLSEYYNYICNADLDMFIIADKHCGNQYIIYQLIADTAQYQSDGI